jgi:hypothetical protein
MRSLKSDVEEEEEEQARSLANSGCGRPPQMMMRISLIGQLGL